MNIYNYLPITVALVTACGVSPQDASDQLDYSAAHSEEWCGYDSTPPLEETDKAWNHPDGFGITGTYGCFDADATWPGGFCQAPFTVNWKVRIYQDGQDAAWFKNATDEFGATQSVLNTAGWNITRVGNNTFNMTLRTGTTNPDGSGNLGTAVQGQWTNRGNVTGQGDYWTYKTCDAWLFKTSIDNNVFYQAASSTQKTKYLKNLWQHEMGHCFGLPHTTVVDTRLMSNVYYFPGPMFDSNLNFVATEVEMFEDFNPLN